MAQAGINPLLFGDPTAQASLDQLQRQQQWAQTLLEQSQQSPQGQMVGDRYVRPSITQGLAQLLKAYMGRQGVDDASKQMADVQAKAYASLLAKNSGMGAPGTAGAVGSAGGGANYGEVLTRAMFGDPAALKQLEWFSPDPDVKKLQQAGATSQQIQDFLLGKAKKDATAPGVFESQQAGLTPEQIQQFAVAKGIKDSTDPTVYRRQQSGFTPDQIFSAEAGAAAKEAEIDRKNGNVFVNPFLGASGIVPKIPDNAQASSGVDQFGNPIGGVTTIPGAQQIVGGNTRATEANKIITNVEGPGGVKFTGYGSQFAGGGAPSPNVLPATPLLGTPSASLAGAPQQSVRLPGFAGADPLVQKTKEGQIELMKKDFEPQFQRSSNAQGTINNLQQIMGYAQSARTGQQSDKLRLVDSVLSMMGSQDATQRQIAGDLLGKNANQIVARLGNGDMGTDAARQILISAYPNAKMMSQAIEEAAQNLIAQQHLVRARTQVLSPKYNGGDFQGYNETAQKFDALADPRIFQWKGMPAGPAKDAYRAYILKQDPTLMQKAKALAELGVQ